MSLATVDDHALAAAPKRRRGDAVFSAVVKAAGVLIVLALAGVAIFLVYQGAPAFTAAASDIPGGEGLRAFTWPLLFGTLLSSVIALVLGTPLAVGIALFISFYSHRRLASSLGYMIDLLAAVPSVVFGLWGANFLGPRLVPLFDWLAAHLGWVPFFAGPASPTGRTMMTAGVVLAIMIVPIVTALSREVFLQTPRLQREAAMALGTTRWEMIRSVVLPFGRSGVVSATMLGLGRALGETMAVAMVLSVSGGVTFNLISPSNPSTIAANIALQFPEATGIEVNALIATGLVLFAITFVVNFFARLIVQRSSKER